MAFIEFSEEERDNKLTVDKELLAQRKAAYHEQRRLDLQARETERQVRQGILNQSKALRTGTNVQKMDVIIGRFVDQLIDENRGTSLQKVDLSNPEMVKRRKDQMGIIRDHINLIKQLKEVRAVLHDEEDQGEGARLQTTENVILLDEAKELLAQKGLRTEF